MGISPLNYIFKSESSYQNALAITDPNAYGEYQSNMNSAQNSKIMGIVTGATSGALIAGGLIHNLIWTKSKSEEKDKMESIQEEYNE